MIAEILLVEDNPGDVLLIKKALEKSSFESNLHVCENGEDALNFLIRREPFQDSPRPNLILLDINIPRVNGQEVLEQIKTNDDLKTIPVVMLTSSNDERDIALSYKNHANSYITKTADIADLRTIVASLDHYWFNVVTLPEQ